MGNVIVGLILVLLVVFAVRNARRHFKGEGGCCGGGCTESCNCCKKEEH